MRVKPSVTNALEVCQDAVDRSKSQRYSRSEIQFAGGAAMAVSQKIREFMEQGSWIRKMFEEGIALRQRFGDDAVFDLSLGNPVLEPPDEFFAELKRIADDPIPGMHRYMPNAGYPETRAAVAAQLAEETGLDFSADHVVMSCGAGGALNVVLKTLLDPGDEVVIFAPYFVEYFFYADNHGGSCRVVPPVDGFLPDFDALEATIDERTRVVLINSPNNPSGVVYPEEALSRMGEIIADKEAESGREIFLVSDEPYRRLLFDGLDYPHIFHHHPRSIVATSHSKDLALPGERIGYVAAHPDYSDVEELMDGLVFCNRTLGFVNAPALMQHIVAKLQSVTVDVGQYQDKRDFMYDRLTEIGYEVVKPEGAFYMFPRSPMADDVEFVAELQKYNVLVVPGTGFGMPGYFRLSFCVTDETLAGSIPGFRKAFVSG